MRVSKPRTYVYPEFIHPAINRHIYSEYLNGKSSEMICFSLYQDPRTFENGEWEGIGLTSQDIDEIIDFYNEINNI